MLETGSREKIIESIQESNQRAADWFQQIPAANFFARQGEAWSPSDNLDHLIKTARSIARALKLPNITLHAMFGKPERSSVSYDALCQRYREAIAGGGQASGRYLPEQMSPVEDAEDQKRDLLKEWANASSELVSVVKKWEENDLDRYLLPHPLLGKLTIREMLYFTIYHNLRHASQEGD